MLRLVLLFWVVPMFTFSQVNEKVVLAQYVHEDGHNSSRLVLYSDSTFLFKIRTELRVLTGNFHTYGNTIVCYHHHSWQIDSIVEWCQPPTDSIKVEVLALHTPTPEVLQTEMGTVMRSDFRWGAVTVDCDCKKDITIAYPNVVSCPKRSASWISLKGEWYRVKNRKANFFRCYVSIPKRIPFGPVLKYSVWKQSGNTIIPLVCGKPLRAAAMKKMR